MQTDTSIRRPHSLIASDRVEGTPVRRSNGEKIGTIDYEIVTGMYRPRVRRRYVGTERDRS